MMRALSTAGTGMVAQQYNLDVIANNLANVNTTAFKTQRAEFQDVMYQTFRASGATVSGSVRTPESTQVGLGSRFVSSSTNFVQGALQSTGNALDLAINGDGFFQVERPDGSIAYTRDGSFKRDANGLIVTNDGYPLVPNITIPTEAKAITISPNGQVSAVIEGQDAPQDLESIQLYLFANPAGLTRIGQNLYTAGGASGDAISAAPGSGGTGIVQSGVVEGSNVSIVDEMVRMILAQRAYEVNSKAIQTADDMLGVLNQLKR